MVVGKVTVNGVDHTDFEFDDNVCSFCEYSLRDVL